MGTVTGVITPIISRVINLYGLVGAYLNLGSKADGFLRSAMIPGQLVGTENSLGF